MNASPSTLPHGIWGGEQVVLEVGSDKAILRLGCAQGEFPAPIVLDAGGRFSGAGLYQAFGGGPSTPADRSESAKFNGIVEGDQLVLTVVRGRSSDTYRLSHGVHAKVIRCL